MKYRLYLDNYDTLWVLNAHETINELDPATVENYHLGDFPRYDIEADFDKYIAIYSPAIKTIYADYMVARLRDECLHGYRILHYARQLVSIGAMVPHV